MRDTAGAISDAIRILGLTENNINEIENRFASSKNRSGWQEDCHDACTVIAHDIKNAGYPDVMKAAQPKRYSRIVMPERPFSGSGKWLKQGNIGTITGRIRRVSVKKSRLRQAKSGECEDTPFSGHWPDRPANGYSENP